MPKQVILTMQDVYPFGECQDGDDQDIRVMVRRVINIQSRSKEAVLTRANFFRRLNHSCIIHLEQILQEQSQIQLLYEYVPIRMQTWISNISENFIEGFCRQLIEFGDYLAKCYISIDLTLGNVGMDENYRPKYFLDLNFTIDEKVQKNKLKTRYQHQVLSLFKPYVQNKLAITDFYRNPSGKNELLSNHKQQKSSIGTIAKYQENRNKVDKLDSISVTNPLKIRQRAVALQKQRKNQSINVCGSQYDFFPSQRNRKQSILSSVSNVKINRLGRRIDEIKSKLRNIYSPQPMHLKHQERSIEKHENAIAFNYDSTERFTTNNSPKLNGADSAIFCQNILKNLQQQETIFQKIQKNLTKQLFKGMPMKKNQTLKAKEYQQMKKSDDGYFKDFFSVLEDKPKLMAQEKQKALPKSKTNLHQQRYHMNGRDQKKTLAIEPLRDEQPKQLNKPNDKANLVELENRVKSAINKSRNLIEKFKGDR